MFHAEYFHDYFTEDYFPDHDPTTPIVASLPKHIDFEPPSWSEFAASPTTSGGAGATLTQTTTGAFPDRP